MIAFNANMNFSSVNSSFWRAESVAISLGFSIIFLLGTLGNSLVLAVLSRSGQMNTKSTNLFILNLGVAYLCFIVFCVPFQATIYTVDEWVFGPVLCKGVHFIIFLTMYASMFTLTAVSLDRYLAICCPLRPREMRTPKNAALSICLVWFGYFPLNHTTYILRILSHLVAYTNSCLNSIVYALVSKHFHKGFRKVFSCTLRRSEVNKVHVIQAVNTGSSLETSN